MERRQNYSPQAAVVVDGRCLIAVAVADAEVTKRRGCLTLSEAVGESETRFYAIPLNSLRLAPDLPSHRKCARHVTAPKTLPLEWPPVGG